MNLTSSSRLLWLMLLKYGVFSATVYADPEQDAWTKLVGKQLSNKPEFEFVQNNSALPNVLIYGDSISMGYTAHVRKKLKDEANVYRIRCNGGNVARVIPTMTKMSPTLVVN